ncbi:MAG: MotA/TolQ/ExbB proton channel family protein [Verrucomicrobia bacterium]|nr:MotA/TolQ/ExbB proton channel family protein [Verrucomicrobiota bacterium]MBU1735639.1 MotA/TolQ/ExbB proton channel family protein [Verrucomicrobiota bacterium]MBU1856697.1 MotA/TolQ/ExbB proton channel family protein [Verrucomicrobiota bacterium]
MQTRWFRFLMAAMVIGLLLGGTAQWTGLSFTTTAYAQASATTGGGAAPAVDDKNKKPETFMDYWNQGGMTMWPLLGTAVWATAILIELLMKLRVRIICPTEIIQQLYQTLLVKDYQKAWKIGMDNPCVATRILCAALEKLPNGREAFDIAALESASNETNVFKNKNAYINLNATISPLLGLFGTIAGMMGAFNSMAFSGAVGDPSKLAGDIGTALVTTYTGLAIAIPGLCAYYILGNRIKKVMEYVQSRLTVLFDEIDFDNIPADLVIVTKEARMAYLGGGKAGMASGAPAPKASAVKTSTAARPSTVSGATPANAEHVACPNCSKEVTVGDKKCQHCNAELDWE